MARKNKWMPDNLGVIATWSVGGEVGQLTLGSDYKIRMSTIGVGKKQKGKSAPVESNTKQPADSTQSPNGSTAGRQSD
ncbi:MAG: hypothetical protein IJ228_05740 [Succinivibrio sp.]|nr:hypothetical protein [Succinivibrio sp.]